MIHFFLDIETIPAQDAAVQARYADDARQHFKVPATLTKEQAAQDLGIIDKDLIKSSSKDKLLAQWQSEFKDQAIHTLAQEAWRKTALDGALGHLCVIGYAIDAEPPMALSSADPADEALLLRSFFNVIEHTCQIRPHEKITFIGHNLIDFDLRFLFQRAVILAVQPPAQLPLCAKPWDERLYDTLQRWGSQRGGSLDKISKACGLQGKGEINGSMVWPYVQAGRLDDIANYCKHDIELTRQLYLRMTFQTSLPSTAGEQHNHTDIQQNAS